MRLSVDASPLDMAICAAVHQGTRRGRDLKGRRRFGVLWIALLAPVLATSLSAVRTPDPVLAAEGDIETVAGGLGFGVGTSLATPVEGLGLAPDGSALFLADRNGWLVVRRLDLSNGQSTVHAGDGSHLGDAHGDGGPATLAGLHHPTDVAVDSGGNVYIADSDNYRIRRVDAETETITTIAGNGTSPFTFEGGCDDTGTQAEVDPHALAIDGSTLYVTEPECNRVRAIDLSLPPNTDGTFQLQPFAGGGPQSTIGCNDPQGLAINAALSQPQGVAVGPDGAVYISDTENHCVRVVREVANAPPSGEIVPGMMVSTYAGGGSPTEGIGDGGPATGASLNRPVGLSMDPSSGNLYIADSQNYRVRVVVPGDGPPNILTAVGGGFESGDGVPPTGDTGAWLERPTDVEAADDVLYIADNGSHRVRVVDFGQEAPAVLTASGNGEDYSGGDGPAAGAQFDLPVDSATGPSGEIYVGEGNFVRRIGTDGVVTRVAGDPDLEFWEPNALDSVRDVAWHDGNLYVATMSRVVKVDLSNGTYEVVAGMLTKGTFPPEAEGGVPATDVTLCPTSIAFAPDGDLYISDGGLDGDFYWGCTNRVWRVDAQADGTLNPDTSLIHPFAGRASTEGDGNEGSSGDGGPALAAEFRGPTGLAVDSAGNVAVVDYWNCTVRMVNVQTGIISRVAGEDPGQYGCMSASSASPSMAIQQAGDGGPATSAFLFDPHDVAFDEADNMFIAHASEVRRVDAQGIISTLAGGIQPGFAGDGGPATSALLHYPRGIEIRPDGDLLIADTENMRVRRVNLGALPTDLALSMSPNTLDPAVGEAVTFTSSVLNNGPVSAINAVVTQQIPAGWAFESASVSQGTCSSGTGTVTCILGSLADPGSATVTTVLTPTAAGPSNHTASATTGLQPDAVPGNNSDSVALDVRPIATGGVGQTPTPEPPTGPIPTPTPPPSAPPGSAGPLPTPVFVAGGSQPTPSQAVLGTNSKPDEGDRPGLRRAAPRVDPTPTPAPTRDAAPTEAPDPGASGEPAPVDQPGGGLPTPEPMRFARSVPSLADVPTELALLAQSVALAMIVLLLIMFPAQIFNSTLEAHHDEVVGWFAPWALGIRNIGRALDNFWRTPPGIAVFLLLTGVLYALLDPTIGPTFDGLLTVIGLTLGLAVVTFVAALPLLLVHRRDEQRPIAAALPISLIVGVVCVLLSRLADFQPGYVYGLIIGFIFARELSIAEQGRANAIAAGFTLVVVVASFFGLGVMRQGGVEGALPTVIETALAVIAVAGLEQVMFSLVPMRFLPGAPIYAWNRLAWALLLGLSLFAFFHILINPASGYLSDTSRSGLLLTLALVGGFGIVSVSFWGYFRFRPVRPPHMTSGASEG